MVVKRRKLSSHLGSGCATPKENGGTICPCLGSCQQTSPHTLHVSALWASCNSERPADTLLPALLPGLHTPDVPQGDSAGIYQSTQAMSAGQSTWAKPVLRPLESLVSPQKILFFTCSGPSCSPRIMEQKMCTAAQMHRAGCDLQRCGRHWNALSWTQNLCNLGRAVSNG